MMNHNAQTAMLSGTALMTGLLVGIGAGLLLAPESGARTRRRLHRLAERLHDHAGVIADEAKQAVTGLL
ncbi:YtxH domain-containing protein [Nitrospira moscoviensis]|nr:YtxH domain-containing protein [Nitrospira moscoviensis]